MNAHAAENYIYRSYNLAHNTAKMGGDARIDLDLRPDRDKRHPELSADILRELERAPNVLVTGSKGKGSTAAMLAAMLRRHGPVGLLTSPHLAEFRERIRVDCQMITEEDFTASVERLRPRFDAVQARLGAGEFISPIGVQAAVALDWFARRGTAINVLECGKGVQFDDVNNVSRKAAIINTIFLEHTRELGASLEEIARDKTHIIDSEMEAVFVGLQTPEVITIIEERARTLGVPVYAYGRDFDTSNVRWGTGGMIADVRVGEFALTDVTIPLLGEHQVRNFALAFACALHLGANVDNSLASVANVRWPGRLEMVREDPPLLLDACINRQCAEDVLATLESLNLTDVCAIVGIPDDKDWLGVLEALDGKVSEIVLTRASNPHYLFTDRQAAEGKCLRTAVVDTSDLSEALEYVGDRSAVVIGTTAIIADAYEIVKYS